MYLDQEVAFLSGKHKKAHGKQKNKVKNTEKNPENIIFKQKCIIN